MYLPFANYNNNPNQNGNNKQPATGAPSSMYNQPPSVRPGSGQGFVNHLSSPAPAAPPALSSRIMGNGSMNLSTPLAFSHANSGHLMQQQQQPQPQHIYENQPQPQRYQTQQPQLISLQQLHHQPHPLQQQHHHQQQHQQPHQNIMIQQHQKDSSESIQDGQASDTKKRRGRPKKFILDPSTNEYIDSTHPNFKALNRVFKKSTKRKNRTSNPQVSVPNSLPNAQPDYESEEAQHARKMARLQDKPPYLRSLEDETVKNLIKKKDRRGRPRKFPVEQTGITIKGIRVNGTPGAVAVKSSEDLDDPTRLVKTRNDLDDGSNDINATIQSVIPSHLQHGL